MEILEIGEGSYIVTLEGKNYALFRTNIPIRIDSENLVYMVKMECEEEGYFTVVQTQVSFKQLQEGKAAGKTPLKVFIEAILPMVQAQWKMDFSAAAEKIG